MKRNRIANLLSLLCVISSGCDILKSPTKGDVLSTGEASLRINQSGHRVSTWQSFERPVEIIATCSDCEVAPGEKLKVAFDVSIDSGWYIYGNTSGPGRQTRLTIEVPDWQVRILRQATRPNRFSLALN
jgi:hypothetical protein